MAVELVLSSSKTIKQVADELNINDKTLANWITLHKKSNAALQTETNKTSVNNTNNQLSEENKQLRKENARLKTECEILKKATATMHITTKSKASCSVQM